MTWLRCVVCNTMVEKGVLQLEIQHENFEEVQDLLWDTFGGFYDDAILEHGYYVKNGKFLGTVKDLGLEFEEGTLAMSLCTHSYSNIAMQVTDEYVDLLEAL